MDEPTCSVEGCDKPVRARGMCGTDWDRWRQALKKAGLPLPPKPPRRHEPETVAIYALLEPGTRKPRYVGHSGNPARRLKEHWRRRNYEPYAQDNPDFAAWLCSLDGPPEIRLLEVVPYEDRFTAEERHTDLLRQLPGIELLNIYAGAKVPEVTRAKMKASHTGTKASAETRAKRSASVKSFLESHGPTAHNWYGKKHSPETLRRMSIAQKARYQRERARAFDPDEETADGR